jgi:hypothetical protein
MKIGRIALVVGLTLGSTWAVLAITSWWTRDPLEVRLVGIAESISISPRWHDPPTDVTDAICPEVGNERLSSIAASGDRAWGIWINNGLASCFFELRLLIVSIDPDSGACHATLDVPPGACI